MSLHEKLKEHLEEVMVVNGASVLQIEFHNSPVKCHALQGHVNPMTPLRRKGVTSLHEKLKDHQVLKQGKCATN